MKNTAIPMNATRTALSLMAFCSLLLFASCEDLLDEAPKQVVEELFYATAADVESAVNACYLPTRGGAYTASFYVIVDVENDWGYGRGSRAQYNDWTAFNSTNKNRCQGPWNSFYQGIRNANLVIKNAPTGLSQGQTEVNQFVAEAKFMRAYYYFQLVRCWGGVPLRTLDNMEEKDVARSTPAQVYDLIVADLIDAEAGLPTVQSLIGRPTTYAAKTMLADAYMDMQMFPEAQAKAKEVIDAKAFSLVPWTTRDDWYLILAPEVISSTEEIWFIKYAAQQGMGNFMGWIVNHGSTGLFNFNGAYAHFANARDGFYQNWPDNDLRKALWDFADFGFADSTIVTRKYKDQNALDNSDAGMDLPMYRYAEVLYIYAEADARIAGAPTTEAMEMLNQIRRRGYGEDIFTPSANDYDIANYNIDSFIDLVIEERGYEFVFEAKRWFTLKRTGKLAEVLLANRGVVVPEARHLWPIPISEMNFNDLVNDEDQNPGY